VGVRDFNRLDWVMYSSKRSSKSRTVACTTEQSADVWVTAPVKELPYTVSPTLILTPPFEEKYYIQDCKIDEKPYPRYNVVSNNKGSCIRFQIGT
jgi:hypothetical protein